MDAHPEALGPKGETRTAQPTRLQRAIVRRAAESRATIPDLELSADVRMDACTAAARQGGHSITAMLVRACALALRAEPGLNAAYRDGRFERYARVNLGVVCETNDGYAVPTVLDADTKSLTELTGELESLAGRAADATLTPADMAGATFTLADFGAYAIPRWTALVAPQQAAMLVAGAIRTVPTVRDGNIVPGEMVTLTLGCDHRILYPRQAASWLVRVRRSLEESAA